METNYAEQAKAYYTLIAEKNSDGLKDYLHSNVEFYSPLGTYMGREEVLEGVRVFMNRFTSMTVRSHFGSKDQAVIIYNTDIVGIANNFPSASLLSFKDGLIAKIEVFYDPRPFFDKKVK